MENQLHIDITDRLQLAGRLKALREKKQLTTRQVAQTLLGGNANRSVISLLEQGAVSNVPAGHLQKLAKAYGVTFEALTKGVRAISPETVVMRDNFWQPADVTPGVAYRLRSIRQALGLSLLEMSAVMGHTSAGQTRALEAGTSAPQLESLLDIATKTGVCVSWLIKGSREGLSRPTQAARLRALRASTGASRPALAMRADPLRFVTVRSQLVAAETGERALQGATLDKVARALDVPVQWLIPPEGYRESGPAPKVDAELDALLPSSVRALLAQIKELALIDQFSSEDAAELAKALTGRTCRRLSGKDVGAGSLLFGANMDSWGRALEHDKPPGPRLATPATRPRGRPRLSPAPEAPACSS